MKIFNLVHTHNSRAVFFLALFFTLLCCTSCAYAGDMGGHSLVNAEGYDGLAISRDTLITETAPETTTTAESTAPAVSKEIPTTSAETAQTTTTTAASQTTTPATTTTAATTEVTTKETTAATTTTTTTTTPATTTTTTPPPVTEAPESPSASTYKALNHAETTAVWISYIELSDVLTGKSEAQFRAGFAKMMDNCLALGINTVYVHLRPFGDALYRSALFAWSKYATGTAGTAPDFDPLEIMLDEAHSRNISFHGWLNPMRVSADIAGLDDGGQIAEWYKTQNGTYIVNVGAHWYLNPAYKEVRELVAAGGEEIASKYKIDGLHIDDYFYPTTDASFDSAAFSSSGYATVSEMRFASCTALVKGLYNATKAGNATALFGISPQGSIENNYNLLYADVELWCGSAGYCDYVAPQIYYGFNNTAQPYADCLARWVKLSAVKLIPGLSVYKLGTEDTWAGAGKLEWVEEDEILKRQILLAQSSGTDGVAFYSYNHLFNPAYQNDKITEEISAMKPVL